MNITDNYYSASEQRLTAKELSHLLNIEYSSVNSIAQVLRGASLNLYCAFLTLADANGCCRLTQHQLLSSAGINSRETLLKHERWLKSLNLIVKKSPVGNQMGSLYQVRPYTVLPLSEEICKQFDAYIILFQKRFEKRAAELAEQISPADNFLSQVTLTSIDSAAASEVLKASAESGHDAVCSQIEYDLGGGAKLIDHFENNVAVFGAASLTQTAPVDEKHINHDFDEPVADDNADDTNDCLPSTDIVAAETSKQVDHVSAVIFEQTSSQKISADGSDRKALSFEINPASNPFRLSRAELRLVKLAQLSVRVRSEYFYILKIMKSLKHPSTLEELVDDALTFYFVNSEEGREAAAKAETIHSFANNIDSEN